MNLSRTVLPGLAGVVLAAGALAAPKAWLSFSEWRFQNSLHDELVQTLQPSIVQLASAKEPSERDPLYLSNDDALLALVDRRQAEAPPGGRKMLAILRTICVDTKSLVLAANNVQQEQQELAQVPLTDYAGDMVFAGVALKVKRITAYLATRAELVDAMREKHRQLIRASGLNEDARIFLWQPAQIFYNGFSVDFDKDSQKAATYADFMKLVTFLHDNKQQWVAGENGHISFKSPGLLRQFNQLLRAVESGNSSEFPSAEDE